MLRFSAEPNHARQHSKRASFPGGKTARFPSPALDEGDRTRAGRLLRKAGLADQVAGNDPIDDTQHATNECRVGGQKKSQGKGETQNPRATAPLLYCMRFAQDVRSLSPALSDRPLWQHLIDQPGRPIGHALNGRPWPLLAFGKPQPWSCLRCRAPQLGQNPRRLQLNASKCSARQVSHRRRRKPCSSRPHCR